MIWIICLLFATCFSGLAYVLLRATFSGMEAYSGTYSEETARQFEDIFLFIPPRRIAEAGWALAAVAFLFLFALTGSITNLRGLLVGLVIGSLGAGLSLRVPRQLLRFLRKRRRTRFNEQLVDALINMSNALKAGFSITQAIEAVVRDGLNPIAQEFDVFLQQTRVGVSFSDALANLEERVGSEDMTLVASAIETARRTGGNLTEILERIAHTIRERMRIENRIRTLTAQGRLQGIVVSLMPAAIAALMLIFRPQLMRPFLQSTVGILICLAAVVLIACGGLTIRKIVNIDI